MPITLRIALFSLFLALLGGCDCAGNPSTDAGRDTPLSDVDMLDTPVADVPATSDVPADDAPVSSDAAAVSVAISDFAASGNCMPIVPGDPIVATWTVVVSGASGTTASFVRGELVYSGGSRVPVTVDVPSFGLTAGAAMQAQRRVSGATKTDGCGTTCGMGVRLEATYLVDGEEFAVTANDNYDCAF